MKQIIMIAWVMGTFMGSSALAAADVRYACRATSDMARLDFRMISDTQDRAWAIIQLVPNQGNSEQGEKTRDQENPLASPVGAYRIAGRWSATAIQGQLDTEAGEYEWWEPRVRVGRESGVARAPWIYDPFRAGGHVLCQFNAGATQKDMFASVFLIPTGWETALRDAYHVYKKPGHSGDQLTKQEIRELISSDNPITSILSFKYALHHYQIDGQMVEAVVSKSADTKTSILVYIALSLPRQDSAGADGIAKIIENTNDVKVMEELAVGIISVLMFSTEDYILERATLQLCRLKERVADLDISVEDKNTLVRVFAIAGLGLDK